MNHSSPATPQTGARQVSSRDAEHPSALHGGPVSAWLETQSHVIGVWLDRLIAEGDPGDLVSLIHRHQAWIALMRQRLGSG